MRVLPEGGGDVEVLAYSADGSRLAASARPGPRAWLWDLRADGLRLVKEPRTPAPLDPNPPADLLVPLAHAPSGGLLAVGGDRQLSLLEGRTGVESFFPNLAYHQSRRLAFTPDGQTLVSAGDYDGDGGFAAAVILGDVASADWRKLPTPFPAGTEPLALSADASLMLWCQPPARRLPAHLTLWHVPSGQPLARLALNVSPACAAFSPGGRQLALGVGDVVVILEIGHVLDYFGNALRSDAWAALMLPLRWKRFGQRLPPLASPKGLEGHREAVLALAYAPDGTSLFSGGRDQTVRRWDLASQRPREAWSWPVGAVSALAVAPDGMTAAAGGGDGRAVIWDLAWF